MSATTPQTGPNQRPFNYARARIAAQHLGIGVSTLWLWTKSRPGFPAPIKLGPKVTVFDLDALQAFVVGQATQAAA